jgi:rare lipoprotein A
LKFRPYLLLAATALSFACHRAQPNHLPPPIPARIGAVETGVASWYGHPYHGRRTSNGEIYDMNQMTAAHLRLPFDTWVRVTNTRNGEQAEVRINDRGPFIKNRVIDLSREAARRVGMLGPGTDLVRIEIIPPPLMAKVSEPAPAAAPGVEAPQPRGASLPSTPAPMPPPSPVATAACPAQPYYAIQVGSFRDEENAERMQGKMEERYGSAVIVGLSMNGAPLHRVMVGCGATQSELSSLKDRLAADGIDGFLSRAQSTE